MVQTFQKPATIWSMIPAVMPVRYICAAINASSVAQKAQHRHDLRTGTRDATQGARGPYLVWPDKHDLALQQQNL